MKAKDDLYARLEVHPRACPEVIEAAFQALCDARDRGYFTSADDDAFQPVRDAYRVLSDATKRAQYDVKRLALEGTIVGDYRVIAPIAEGGFGRTYRGEHVISGLPVCIKHCSNIGPEHDRILIDEMRAMWDLRHFAMPAVRGLVRLEDGSLALVMSYIPGPTLEQVVKAVGKLDAEHVCWIAERVLNALKYMHYFGVIHGDIKPQNIVVQTKSHMAILVDFGLSAIRPKQHTDAKGYTEFFAPPEQVDGKPPIPETDLYSVGITMLYALSGGDLTVVRRRQIPDSVPDALRRFIRALVVQDPLQRPRWPKNPDERDLCDALREVREQAFGRRRSGMKPIEGFSV